MLEVKGLSISYKEGRTRRGVLDRVELIVPTGTTTAIVGPSGSGKSTLLHAICGLIPVDSGRVLLDGVDITSTPTHQRRLGLVSQSGDLFPTMTVHENIEYGLKMNKVGRKQRRERSEALLEMISMPGFGPRSPETLSGGQSRRVALARALAPEPAVLLMDEPLTGLDPATHDELARDVKALIANVGMTVVLVTHDPTEAADLADRVVEIGSLTGAGDPG